MTCRRCLGFMVTERWVGIDRGKGTATLLAPSRRGGCPPCHYTRCVNCGNLEDPIILLNRSSCLPAGRQHGPPSPETMAHQLLVELFNSAPR